MKASEFSSRLLSSLCKVLPGCAPTGRAVTRVEGLWGETVSFQLAFTATAPQRDLRENVVRVEVQSPLGQRVRVRSVVNVPVLLPVCGEGDDDYISKQPGMYPDLLRVLPAFSLRAVPGQWRALWFDITLDETLTLPEYPLVLHVFGADGALLARHSLTVGVVPAALPPQALIHTQWFHGDCLADYYGVEVFSERHWAIMENFIREAAEHGINMLLTPLFTPPLDTGEGMERTTIQLVDVHCGQGVYSFDFSRLARFVDMAERCGIRYFEMAHLFTQWGAAYAPKILVWEDGALRKKFGWHTPAMGPDYRAFLRAFLPALTAFFKDRGMADRVYFHLSDEPELRHLDAYRAAADFVRPLLAGCKTLDALSDYEFYRTGCVERPVVASDHLEPFLAHGVKGLWTYYCIVQNREVANRFIAMPSARSRILGVQLYLYDIEGFLQWGYNFYNTQHSTALVDPYSCTDGGDAFPAGDPYLVYPGRDGMPEESIRLMTTCEALFDLRALRLLEALRGRAFVDALLHEGLAYRITFTQYPRGEAWLLDMRRRVNGALRAAL